MGEVIDLTSQLAQLEDNQEFVADLHGVLRIPPEIPIAVSNRSTITLRLAERFAQVNHIANLIAR